VKFGVNHFQRQSASEIWQKEKQSERVKMAQNPDVTLNEQFFLWPYD